MSAPTADALKAAAHAYARRGWRVVPLHRVIDTDTGPVCTCKKGRACKTSSGKHPNINEWQYNASRSGADIETWWGERPQSGVGIATGAESGLFVLDVDIDPEKYGPDTLAKLEAEHGELPRTRKVRTGSGGWQLYFNWPGFPVTNSVGTNKPGKLGLGLDIRGNGGQVVAPPSRSGKGHYTLEIDAPLANAPEWLLDLLRPADRRAAAPGGVPVSPEVADHYAAAALATELATLRATKTGRNDQLNRSAFALGQLVAVGALDAQHVRNELTAAATDNGYVAKDGIHAMHATLESGLGKGMENPRNPWPPVGDGLTDDEVAAIWEVYSDDPRTLEWLLGDMNMPEIPARVQAVAATAEEIESFLASFTRYREPQKLGRRIAWMATGSLRTHAQHLVADVIDGAYPAERAVTALIAAYRKRGGTDPDAPRQLLSAALGAVLNAKVSA
jgi:hypothetical protein